MPQAIFQQDQIDRSNRIAAAEQGAGLQETNGFLPATIGDVRRARQGIQLLAQHKDQVKYRIRQFDCANVLLPLLVLLVRHLQGGRDRVIVFILLANQQRAEVRFVLHFVEPQADQHAVI